MDNAHSTFRPSVLAAALMALATASLTAQAGVVLQATSVSTTLGTLSGTIGNLIDQSGLISATSLAPASYVSDVTDFDSFIAAGPRHNNDSFTTWASSFGVSSGSIVFGLGGARNIESFALWSRGFTQQGVREFDLYIADDSGFTTSTLLGSFTAASGSNNTIALAQVFGFAATTGSFVRMDIRSVYGTCCISLSEVAFEANPLSVPEPGSLLLGATALLAGARRLRRASARASQSSGSK